MALAERAEALTRPSAVRSTKKKLGAALSCLLANLLRVRATDQRSFLAISLRNSAFYSVKTHVFGADHFRNVLRYLHDLQLVDKKGGYKFDAGQGTKLRARASLMTFLSQHGFDLKGPVEKRTVLQGSDDCIAIKDGQTVLLTPSNDLVSSMRQRLVTWNRAAVLHPIDLAVPDGHYVGYLRKSREKYWGGLSTTEDNRQDEGLAFVDLTDRTLRRSFCRGSLNLGGRFYKGWWQSIRKEERNRITINGGPTRELDYSGLQLTLLYVLIGKEPEGDPYQLPGIDPQFREMVKELTLKMLNAQEGQRIKLEPIADAPSYEELKRLILEKHKPIEQFFHSDIGVWLQRIDSDLADAVLNRMGRRGLLVLPVHDSFIVQYRHVETLREEMVRAYSEMTGRDPVIKFKECWLESMPGCQKGSQIEDKHIPRLFQDALKHDYHRYWERLSYCDPPDQTAIADMFSQTPEMAIQPLASQLECIPWSELRGRANLN